MITSKTLGTMGNDYVFTFSKAPDTVEQYKAVRMFKRGLYFELYKVEGTRETLVAIDGWTRFTLGQVKNYLNELSKN